MQALAGLGPIDVVGAAAAASTLLAFAQKSMVPMRVSAIAANLLFIAYGGLGPYHPVLVLHLILLPLNIGRLAECLGHGAAGSAPSLLEEWRHRARTAHRYPASVDLPIPSDSKTLTR